MASINKIDLSFITDNTSDIYDIDAKTLDGKQITEFPLLSSQNVFTASNTFETSLVRICSDDEDVVIDLSTISGDGIAIKEHLQDNAFSILQIAHQGVLEYGQISGWMINSYNEFTGNYDPLEIDSSSLYLNISRIQADGFDLEMGDLNYVWQTPLELNIGSSLYVGGFSNYSSLIGSSSNFYIENEGKLALEGGDGLAWIYLDQADYPSLVHAGDISTGRIEICTDDDDGFLTSLVIGAGTIALESPDCITLGSANVFLNGDAAGLLVEGDYVSLWASDEIEIEAAGSLFLRGVSGSSSIYMGDEAIELTTVSATGERTCIFNPYDVRIDAYDTVTINAESVYLYGECSGFSVDGECANLWADAEIDINAGGDLYLTGGSGNSHIEMCNAVVEITTNSPTGTSICSFAPHDVAIRAFDSVVLGAGPASLTLDASGNLTLGTGNPILSKANFKLSGTTLTITV